MVQVQKSITKIIKRKINFLTLPLQFVTYFKKFIRNWIYVTDSPQSILMLISRDFAFLNIEIHGCVCSCQDKKVRIIAM